METDKSNLQRVAGAIAQGHPMGSETIVIIGKLSKGEHLPLHLFTLEGAILYSPWLREGGASLLSQPMVRPGGGVRGENGGEGAGVSE